MLFELLQPTFPEILHHPVDPEYDLCMRISYPWGLLPIEQYNVLLKNKIHTSS